MSDDANKAQSPSGREGPDHGPTVDPITRELRRTSVSQLQMADPSTNEGCLRKWWFDKVLGRSEPSTPAQDIGKEHHGYMEHYEKTGEMRLPDRILRNLHFVPPPGPDLLVEHPMIPTMSDGSSGLAYAPLRAAGVPVVGYQDLVHGRLEKRGGTDIEDTRDPPGTITIIDWKFMRTMEYAKSGPDLVKTIQMAGYGKYRFDVGWPGELVRLAHGYFPEKGRGDLRSIRVDRATIEKSWEHAEGVTRMLVDVARETDPEKVPANRKACRAYNKLCIHASDGYCTAGMHNSLRSIVGARAEQALINPEDSSMTVSILDRIRGTGAQPPTSVAVTVALTGVPDPVAEAAAKAAATAAAVAKLQAEEQELRAAKQFDTVLERVAAHNMGMPAFAGAALAIAQRARPSGNTQGEGTLQPITIEDPAELSKLLVELDTIAAQRAEAAKNAPPPIPAPAPVPVATPIAALNPLLPPEAPIQIAGPAPAVIPTAPAATVAAAAAPGPESKKRGAAKKTDVPKASEGVPEFHGNTINLVVDCAVDGVAATSLHGLVDEWCSALASGTKPPSADIRCAAEGSPLSFGKWVGALAAFVRETATELPPGWYSLDSRGGQVIEVVIDALRPLIRASGGALIRGVR